MLELRNVSFSYKIGQLAVNDVSLVVKEGEFLAIAGRNGSGKTTLTRLVMSLIRPTGGRILLDEADTTKCGTAEIARHIGYVFQNPDRQIFRDTVAEEIAYGPEQLGYTNDKIREIVSQAMANTGLTDLADAYPRTLSKGQKQRVAIASALAMEPKMLILDEPTSGQDCREKLRLMELLAGLNAKGIAIILVTHDMEIMMKYSRRVVVMAAGAKVFDGDTRELFVGGQLTQWGLREPSIVKIANGLKARNISLGRLPNGISYQAGLRGGERHA